MKTSLHFTLTLFTFVTLAFVPSSFAQEYAVRIIYVYPNDIEPQEDYIDTLKTTIKDIQKFYADEMERHGYGRKTFRLETDGTDNVIVHHLKANFPLDWEAVDKIREQLDFSQRLIYLIWVDRHDPDERGGGGIGSGETVRGSGWILVSNFDRVDWQGYRDAWITTAHEIGHAFGLPHDFRNDTDIMSYGGLGCVYLSIADPVMTKLSRFCKTFSALQTIRLYSLTSR